MFIAPPGWVKPAEPKIVIVSTLCSMNATSPSAASQRVPVAHSRLALQPFVRLQPLV